MSAADLATEPTPTEQFGIIEGLSNAEYHASNSVGHSKIEVFRNEDRGPARFRETYITKTIPPRKASDDMEFGSAFDSLLLEQKEIHIQEPATYMGKESQKKDAPLIEKPWNNNAGACQEWHAANPGKIILTAGQIRLMEAMRLAVQNNPDAAELLLQGKPQVTFRARYRWFSVQVRPDKWHPDGLMLSTGKIEAPVIADLKSTEDMETFMKSRKVFGYDRQAALYRRVVREILADLAGVRIEEIPNPEFFFVAVYKSAPVDSQVFRMEKDDWEAADSEVEGDLKYLHKCFSEGVWPGSLRGINSLPPLWRKQRKEIW